MDTLEALETAANDGCLERVRGLGPRRAAAVRGSLDHMLRRMRDSGVTMQVTLHSDVVQASRTATGLTCNKPVIGSRLIIAL